MMNYPLKLGIVGTGAVVEAFHLPASFRTPELNVTALVDRDGARAAAVAAQFGVAQVMTDHRQLVGQVDAVLIATPPQSHGAIACDLLAEGIAVLCEKPLADTPDNAHKMITAAEKAGVVLATAHSRRFHFNVATLRTLLQQGVFGPVQRVEIADGFAFSWGTKTGYMFRPGSASGVLIENGIHVLDGLNWLLGQPAGFEYHDDALGGVESNVDLTLHYADGAVATVKISRTADLANTLTLIGSTGSAQLDLYDGTTLRLDLPQSKVGRQVGSMTLTATTPQDNQAIMAAQLADFARSVVGGEPPRTSGQDGLAAVQLVADCYAQVRNRPVPDHAPLPGLTL